MTPAILVVLGILLVAVILFVTEIIPVDQTALGIIVVLALLGPWTGISPEEAISGFSNPATITVLAMLILSEGVRRTGVVQLFGQWLSRFAGDSEKRQLGVTIALPGLFSGFVNNTPIVALLVPVVSDMAHRGRVSPSKLLIPLSYASMLGGMLTLIGTSTNLLASNVSERLLGHPFSMFEFFELGLLVLVVGSIFLMTVGRKLLPERIKPDESYLDEYGMVPYLAKMRVAPDAPVLRRTIRAVLEESDLDVHILQLVRDGEVFRQPLEAKQFSEDDILLVRANRRTLERMSTRFGLELMPTSLSEEDIGSDKSEPHELAEIVIPSGSALVGKPLNALAVLEQLDARLLAIRRHAEILHERLEDVPLASGDTLLVQLPSRSLKDVDYGRDLLLIKADQPKQFRHEKIPVALGILGAVVLFAALGIVPILISALAGVVLMSVTGVLRPTEMYESVRWDIIFLLAGVIPLGMALEESGAASLLGHSIAAAATVLPALAVLWLLYMATSLVTAFISNNASVLILLPIAYEIATQIGAEPFSFIMAVTFAASAAFIGPLGYQTNLFVYGPGGYKMTDFVRIGLPLQLVCSVVTVAGIWVIWGV